MANKQTKKEKPPKKKNNNQNKRRFRVNKKLKGKTGTILIGSEDPFLYFPDMMSYLERDEIDGLTLIAMALYIGGFVELANAIDKQQNRTIIKIKKRKYQFE